jgi:hypothetical protein
MFKYKPAINIEQFFSDGFAEQKSIMACEIIDNVKRLLKAKISKKAKPDPIVPPRYGKNDSICCRIYYKHEFRGLYNRK